ncbi:hypothetical protein GF361_05375 [Candidatus Woesearchaeota archaeon]|nr:hypothetical protein [Candidatus Woesearchaeota archaeon]
MEKRGLRDIFKGKKAQITVFIIVGILVLLVASGVFYFRYITVREEIPVIPVIEDVPAQAIPVKDYIEECVFQKAEEALRKLGNQGGYVNLESAGISIPDINPTETYGVSLFSNSDIKVPYWWYLESQNNCGSDIPCEFNSQRPELKGTGNTMESQVRNYVLDNLDDCLDFSAFEDQGYEIETKGRPSATAVVGRNDISVYVEYPIEVQTEQARTDIEQFYVSLPLNLRKIYEFATEITNSQMNSSFLEQQAINVIAYFQGLDENMLPPSSEMTFEMGGGTIWSVQKVKKDLESMLMTYIPGLQVPYTLNYERRAYPNNPLKEHIYGMEIPVNLNRSYDDLEIRFDYLGWPTYFNAGSGGIIKPQSMTFWFFPSGMQEYKTNYDLSFPSLITITDPSAFNNKGYSFRFALEGNLRNNRPIDSNFQFTEGGSTFQESLFCNLNQRNSGNITFNIINAVTGEPLEDVGVTYACGEDSCFIGKTDQNGNFIEKFPPCIEGIISFTKYNYFIPAQFLTAELDLRNSLGTLKAYPYMEKEIKVQKWPYSLKNKQIAFNPVNLDFAPDVEQSIVNIRKIKQTPGEEDISTAAIYWGNQTSPPTMRLVPGKYEVDITNILYFEEPYIIPREKKEVSGGFWNDLFGGPDEYTIPAIPFNESYPSGGAILNNLNRYFIINETDLYDDNEIIFYTIAPSLPTKAGETRAIGKIQEYSNLYRSELEPDFKNETQ